MRLTLTGNRNGAATTKGFNQVHRVTGGAFSKAFIKKGEVNRYLGRGFLK